jgi:putative ABC transport system substrate-binding protein
MKRRHFIAALGGMSFWPLAARTQEPRPDPNMTVIGWLSSVSPRASIPLVNAFRDGLGRQGYIEGRDLWIYYRWAEGHYEDLDALADDLIQHNVRLIAAVGGVVSAQAALKRTTQIPILFVSGVDPTHMGLVSSLSRPSQNATGISIYTTELIKKRLEVVHDLVPSLTSVAILTNPTAIVTKGELEDLKSAAEGLGLRTVDVGATSEQEIERAFDTADKERAGAIIVSADPFFTSQRALIVALAAQHKLPACYPWREYPEAGGLVSYGPDLEWAFREVGVYAGRILKGAKVSDLPVEMPTNFELVINRKTAKALNVTIPTAMIVSASELLD